MSLFTYCLISFVIAVWTALFGFGPISLIVWAYSEWKRKNNSNTEEEVDEPASLP
jgi:hypothetical protein